MRRSNCRYVSQAHSADQTACPFPAGSPAHPGRVPSGSGMSQADARFPRSCIRTRDARHAATLRLRRQLPRTSEACRPCATACRRL